MIEKMKLLHITGPKGDIDRVVKAYLKTNKINNFNGNIDDRYTDEFYRAIKEFQRANGLTQTGFINEETFTFGRINNPMFA